MGKHVKMSFTISRFRCPDCDNEMFVSRRKGKQRENGHIKDIWCPYCDKVQKMVEEKDWV